MQENPVTLKYKETRRPSIYQGKSAFMESRAERCTPGIKCPPRPPSSPTQLRKITKVSLSTPLLLRPSVYV